MSLKTEINKLSKINNPFKFKIAVEAILENNIKCSPVEIRMIKSFQKGLCELADSIKSENKIITNENYSILPTEYTYIIPLLNNVNFSINHIKEREEHFKQIARVYEIPTNLKTGFNEQLKELFYGTIDLCLTDFITVNINKNSDIFNNIYEVENFLKDKNILNTLNKIGETKFIYSNYYNNQFCECDSFPFHKTIFITGSLLDTSKEERLLIPIGILLYNKISNDNKIDIGELGFSVSKYEKSDIVEIFAQIFAYYILFKMNLEKKHRFNNVIHLFNMNDFNNDLLFIESILNNDKLDI